MLNFTGMRKFALIFREVSDGSGEISKEEMEKIHHQWKEWSDGIISQDRLESRGARLGPEGKVLKSGGVISDGPFVEIRERLGGFVRSEENTSELQSLMRISYAVFCLTKKKK